MAKGSDLETRLRALLEPDATRGKTVANSVSILTISVALAITFVVGMLHLREASAKVAVTDGAKMTAKEPDSVTPIGNDATLPDGVKIHAIGASEHVIIGTPEAPRPVRIWWRPDGTLYPLSQIVGHDHTYVDQHLPRAPGSRRLQFAFEISGLSKGQNTCFGPVDFGGVGGGISTITGALGQPTWLYFCDVTKDHPEMSFQIGVSHGTYCESLRRPISRSVLPNSQLWQDGSRLGDRRTLPRTIQMYTSASSRPDRAEFAVLIGFHDVPAAKGSDLRLSILDKEGRRLESRNTSIPGGPNCRVVKFTLDKRVLPRVAYMIVESRPRTFVTFAHMATAPRALAPTQ